MKVNFKPVQFYCGKLAGIRLRLDNKQTVEPLKSENQISVWGVKKAVNKIQRNGTPQATGLFFMMINRVISETN